MFWRSLRLKSHGRDEVLKGQGRPRRAERLQAPSPTVTVHGQAGPPPILGM